MIFLGILQVVRFEVLEVLVVVLNIGGGMLIISDSESGEVWFEPPLFHLLIYNWDKNQQSRFCQVIITHKGRNFSGGGRRFNKSLVGSVLLKPFDYDQRQWLKAKCFQIATLFKILQFSKLTFGSGLPQDLE